MGFFNMLLMPDADCLSLCSIKPRVQQAVEVSHLCGHHVCANVDHMWLESHSTNVNRAICFNAAKRAFSRDEYVEEKCNQHDPPCLLQASIRPLKSSLLREFLLCHNITFTDLSVIDKAILGDLKPSLIPMEDWFWDNSNRSVTKLRSPVAANISNGPASHFTRSGKDGWRVQMLKTLRTHGALRIPPDSRRMDTLMRSARGSFLGANGFHCPLCVTEEAILARNPQRPNNIHSIRSGLIHMQQMHQEFTAAFQYKALGSMLAINPALRNQLSAEVKGHIHMEKVIMSLLEGDRPDEL
jgi:hypothetical protein